MRLRRPRHGSRLKWKSFFFEILTESFSPGGHLAITSIESFRKEVGHWFQLLTKNDLRVGKLCLNTPRYFSSYTLLLLRWSISLYLLESNLRYCNTSMLSETPDLGRKQRVYVIFIQARSQKLSGLINTL